MKKFLLATLLVPTVLVGLSDLSNAAEEVSPKDSNATFIVEDGERTLTAVPSFVGETITIGKEMSGDMKANPEKNKLSLKNFKNQTDEWELNVSMGKFKKVESSTRAEASEEIDGSLTIAEPTPDQDNPKLDLAGFTVNSKDGSSTNVIAKNATLGSFNYTFEKAKLALDGDKDKLAVGNYSAELTWTMSPNVDAYTSLDAATPNKK